MKKQNPNQAPPASNHGVLGINVTAETIEAALMRRHDDRTEVLHRFTRARSRKTKLVGAESLAMALPGLKGSDDADYTLHVGHGSSGDGADFPPSDFSKQAGTGKSGKKTSTTGMAGGHIHPFAAQLKEIIQECGALGFGTLELAFAVAPPDVAYVVLTLPSSTVGNNGNSDSSDEENDTISTKPDDLTAFTRKRLLELLPEHHPGMIDQERVAFLPLVSVSDQRRVLAIVAEPTEPVSATLRMLRDKKQGAVLPPTRLLSGELSTYVSLFGQAANADPEERTAIVRVGSEDTLVLFFEGPDLLYGERLHSLSVFDLPETVCSRVILQQDEKKIGDLHSVLLVDGGRNDKLLHSFDNFFPDAEVRSLRTMLAEHGVGLSDTPEEPLRGSLIPGIAAGLAVLEKWPSLETTNLLPRQLKRQERRRKGGAWHTYAAGILVMLLLAVGIGRFATTQSRVNSEREEFRLSPPSLPLENPDLLQARVDSLANAYTTYTRALHILDSLLVGSDQWIQMMSQVTRTVTASGNTWLSKWTPESGVLRLQGSSTGRLNIVDLSRRLNGAIEQVTYEDIGGRRVYNFEMITAIPAEFPQAAIYLRGSQPTVQFDESDLIIHASPPLREPNHPHSH